MNQAIVDKVYTWKLDSKSFMAAVVREIHAPSKLIKYDAITIETGTLLPTHITPNAVCTFKQWCDPDRPSILVTDPKLSTIVKMFLV